QLEQKFQSKHTISFDLIVLKALIQEIETPLKKLNFYIEYLTENRRNPLQPIQSKLIEVRDKYGKLHTDLDNYFSRNGGAILGQFKEILDCFMRGVELPEEIRDEIIRDAGILEEILRPRFLHLGFSQPEAQSMIAQLDEIKTGVNSLKGQMPNESIGV